MLLSGYTAPLVASVDALQQRIIDAASAVADLVESVRALPLSPTERRAVSRACRRCLATSTASVEALLATRKALHAITTNPNPNPRNATASPRTPCKSSRMRPKDT